MGWLFANLFLLAVVLTGAGYTWLAFKLLKLAHMEQSLFLVSAAFIVALVATYFTMKWVHSWIERRI